MYDVITIGTATRDVFLKSSLFRVVRDPHFTEKAGFPTGEAECFSLGSKLEIEKPVFAMGGGAVNSAVTFARQGFSVGAVIKIGKDALGEEIVRGLKDENVVPLALHDTKVGTGYSTILLAPSGERTVLVYRGASSLFKKSELAPEKLTAKSLYIVPGNVELSLIKNVIDGAKSNGVGLVAMNPSRHYLEMGFSKLKTLFSKIDVVIMNREEAAYLTGVDFGNDHGIFKKLDEMIKGIVVMTDGSRGVVVSDGKNIYKAGVFKEKELVDRTGAGDAFGSGFIAGLLRHHFELPSSNIEQIKYAIRLGAANATSVVEHIGATGGILTKHDFEDGRWKELDVVVQVL